MSDYHLHLHPHGGKDEEADDHKAGQDDFHSPPLGEYPAGLIEAYVERAAKNGVTELGFTEHLYRTEEGLRVLGPFWERETRTDLALQARLMVEGDRGLYLDRYVAAIIAAKERGLPVKLGLEVDFFSESIDAVLELLAQYPFDFLIGSVHWVGGWSIDASDVVYEFDRRGIDQAWEDYFELVADLAHRGVVDVLAHVDVCKKFGYRPEIEPVDLYEQVISGARFSGTAVEVSSQGLRRPVGEIYPSPTFLKMFHDAGVGITLASDAHEFAEAGYGHEQVVNAALAAGYEGHLRFERRRSYEVPLA